MKERTKLQLRRLRAPMAGALVFIVTLIGLWTARAGWAASADEDYLAYAPAVFGEAAGPGATPTTEATGTTTPTATATGAPTETPSPTATPTQMATGTVGPTATSTSTPKPTNTPKPTATLQVGEELLVFDWNKLVEQSHHGFPWDLPPMESANGDWTTPINFAEGTLYIRAEVRGMPTHKDMQLQFCFWQFVNTNEECTSLQPISFTGNTVVVTWSQKVDSMWEKSPIDWTQPRHRNGVAIKNSAGKPVSDYSNWNWNGEIPTEWYPMDLRFTVVVVEKGKGFSGWDNYIP
jgi:hypothetical protein